MATNGGGRLAWGVQKAVVGEVHFTLEQLRADLLGSGCMHGLVVICKVSAPEAFTVAMSRSETGAELGRNFCFKIGVFWQSAQ